ncbi:MAG: hypothetical protein OXM55_03835 [Bdellovibrionales bacterium]|nr:hypothetical protein [Bdellovibrionales bacterium]
MLDLHNVLWVIPGVIFIHFYNKRRPDDTISLSGWPYLFFLVVIAALTWLPAEFIVKSDLLNIKTFLVSYLGVNENTIILLIAIICAFMWFLFAQGGAVSRWIFLPAYDNFYKKCIEWENKEILLTLKNEKAYHCLLWKYPENPKSRHESQTISIIPYKSGYRDEKTKEVVWNTYYPEYRDKSDLVNMEVIIPRTEIITFGKFSKRTFEHFEKQQS